tara:strand:+ start:377 stop:943 length:567 start_codon:yes stop_codon:yes gene_type:complete
MITSTNKITVTDNFLPDNYFNKFQKMILGNQFPWIFSHSKVEDETGNLANYQMAHVFKDPQFEQNTSEYADRLNIFLSKLNMQAIFRIKANLEVYRTNEPYFSTFHVDCGEDEVHVLTVDGYKNKKTKDMTTGIFYVNTCNGYTEFEDGTIVNSVANRFVSFPASIKHRGVSQTNTKARVVINFNYWT